MKENGSARFKAEKFVENLLTQGDLIACDNSVDSANQNELPSFYDKALFERGKFFYHRNIMSLFFSNILGLLTLLSIPYVIKILTYTNKSSTPMTAYKRYLSTVFHMCIWYDGDFTPGSQLWKSMCNVKNKHNTASKKCCAAGMSRIKQKDMVLTQFGFMGYTLARSEMVGIHNESAEDFYAFTHIWRVIGYIMGIEDRFNICRESVEETREICKMLIEKVFRPEVEKKNEEFIEMSSYLINGMWTMNPFLQTNVFLVYLHQVIKGSSNNSENKQFIKLNSFETSELYLIIKSMYYMKYSIIRNFVNFLQILSMWFIREFPLLAYYKFGIAHSYINIYK